MADKTTKILIADDEKPLGRAMEIKLSNLGYSPVVVTDGEAALDEIKKQKFDLILLDLVMPKVDGFGVLKALQEMKSDTPVVVLSNLSQEEDIQKVKELGAKDYFIKSDSSLADIIEHIKQYL